MRSNIILAVIAAALAVPTTLSYMSDARVFTDYGDIPRMFPGFTEDQVNVILLRQPKDPATQALPGAGLAQPQGQTQFDQLSFVKRNNRWVIFGGDMDGAPILQQKLDERVFQHMKSVRVDPETIIFPAADADTLRENRLTPELAFGISCQFHQQPGVQGTVKDILAEVLIGREARDGSYAAGAVPGFLVRKSDSNDVVLYEVPFWERPLDRNAWIDQDVHDFEGDTAVSFSIDNPTSVNTVFERKPQSEGTWIAVEKPEGVGAVRQGEVVAMITRYSRILGITLIGHSARQNLPALGLLPPVAEVSATLEDGSLYTLKIGNPVEGKNEYYALSGGLDFVRTIPAWAVENFLRDTKDLFDPQ